MFFIKLSRRIKCPISFLFMPSLILSKSYSYLAKVNSDTNKQVAERKRNGAAVELI